MAIAKAVQMCKPGVVSAYPITPQTHIVEELATMVADGHLNAQFVNVESEHSAASVVLGASATGVRTFTATSSQGLLYMAEVIFNIAGLRLPVESHVLQAFVTEPVKPVLDAVVSFGATHFYVSQDDKGGLVMGSDLENYNSYGQRGDLPVIEETMADVKALIPLSSRLRVVRQWSGIVDMTMDGSPFICKSPIDGLYIDGGWNYGGFKATPASGFCFAHTLARDEPHELNARFTLDRFRRGYPIDEKGMGPTPWAH